MSSVIAKPRVARARSDRVITVVDTAYLYPQADIDYALANTSYKYTRVGNRVICPTIDDVIGVASDMYLRTAAQQPNGNPGYALGRGTLLNVFDDIYSICLTTGETVLTYRLFQQVSPQTNPPIVSPGTPAPDTPNRTIGFGVIFTAFGLDAGSGPLGYLEPVRFLRAG